MSHKVIKITSGQAEFIGNWLECNDFLNKLINPEYFTIEPTTEEDLELI